MQDNTGKPPSDRDVADAISAVRNQIIAIPKITPELMVNLPNIHRCLLHYKAVLGLLGEAKEGGK